MTHTAAAFGSLQGCRADAGLPAHLGLAGPQLMTERAILRLVFENRYWHENDHAQAGAFQSWWIEPASPLLPAQAVFARVLKEHAEDFGEDDVLG